tara:strand:+ start:246 stop:581 length:336 start_codon:yes stop_codon:yes gene_type:complete
MTETDPNGLDLHTKGAKADAGKTRLGLVFSGFSAALEQVGRVGTYGSLKYTDEGWLSVSDGQSRYTDAMLRHLLTEMQGEVFDVDTGLYHSAQVAWNALARLELQLKEEKK